MSNWPFRFIHAGNFHLEQPIYGLAEVPDHLRETFLAAHFRAAQRVFDAALAEEVDFVVLSGDLVQSQRSSPRSLVFLVRQFERLAERNIAVYWAGGSVDPPRAWPAAMALPENVHTFPVGRAADFLHSRDEKPLARLVGRSREDQENIGSYQLRADVGGLFTIAVVSGTADEAELTGSSVDYWALGGRQNRSTLCTSPVVAHWPGSPQGRSPRETGPHGATLVQVDESRRVRSSLLPTDEVRWHHERIEVDASTHGEQIERMLRERIEAIRDGTRDVDRLIRWTIAGDGPLMAQLRHGTLAADLLDWLHVEYGTEPPVLWTISLMTEAAAALPHDWYEQESILGDYLRTIREHQTDEELPLSLEAYLSERHLAGTLAGAVELSGAVTRQRVLRQAALLGVDLLSGDNGMNDSGADAPKGVAS